MRGPAKATLQVLVVVAGIALATVAYDFLGYGAALVASLLLLIAVLVRSPALALVVAGGSAIFLLLLFNVVCDFSIQGCTPLPETAFFMAWLAVLAVGGFVVAMYAQRRRQPI